MIPKSESRTFTVFTTTNTPSRTLDRDTQVAFTVVPLLKEGDRTQVSAVAWKLFSFSANTDAKETAEVTYSHRISTANIEEERVWDVNVNSVGLSAADHYIALTEDMRWGSYRLTDGSDDIVAINQTDMNQTFTIGTMARRQGFEPLIVLDALEPYDAVTFKLPSHLQAFAVSDYEVGQIIQHTDGQLLEPTHITELDIHTYWHLYTGENGPVLEKIRYNETMPALPGEIPTNVPQAPNFSSTSLSTPVLHELSLPPDLPVFGEHEGIDPNFERPVFTPPRTPDPEVPSPPSSVGSPRFLPIDTSDNLPSPDPQLDERS